jgi:hypothetical protein
MPGPGGQGGTGGPADFSTQYGAVNAFLNAVKEKDAAKLKEATALHAIEDNKGKRNEKLFTGILDESISEDEIDELAKRLEGYQISGHNDAKSSGRLGVILAKGGQNGEYFQRTITVRREKSGWKVDEIGGEGKFERPVMGPTRGRMRGRR